jgi:hypothetical protein
MIRIGSRGITQERIIALAISFGFRGSSNAPSECAGRKGPVARPEGVVLHLFLDYPVKQFGHLQFL